MAYGNMYRFEIRHDGLHKYRVIRGSDRHIVEATALAQRRKWEEEYARKLEIEGRRQEREQQKLDLEENLLEADDRTREAQAAIGRLEGILLATLRVDDCIDWDTLKQTKAFSQPPPAAREYIPIPLEPKADESRYRPQLSLMDKFIHSSAAKKEDAARILYAADHQKWMGRVSSVEATNQKIYETNLREYDEWQKRVTAFEAAQKAHNEAVDRRRTAYQALNAESIEDYCELVLSRSVYPDCLPQTYQVQYRAASKTLIVEYQLPAPRDLPRLAEVKFVRSRGEFVETELPKRKFDTFYESILCQIAIRTIHELFEADSVRALDNIVLNGLVEAINPGTGRIESKVVLSIKTDKTSFLSIDLRKVDPRACFDSLSGKASSKLVDLQAVSSIDSIRHGENEDNAIELNASNASALDEWQEFTKTISDEQNVRFLQIGTLAKLLGFSESEKYSIGNSREIATAVTARGFALEPDARYEGVGYRQTDEIALFRPREGSVTSAYIGAIALLKLSVMVAAADDHPTEEELDVFRNFIRQNQTMSAVEEQRLVVQELVLCRNPEIAKRSLSRLSKRLQESQRRLICEVLVCVAGADGIISSSEWSALDKACKSLALPASALGEILEKLGATFDEPIIQEAASDGPGEPLPATSAKPQTAPSFHLDMARVATISSETSEVIGLLSAVMEEDAGASMNAQPATGKSNSDSSTIRSAEVPTWLSQLEPKLQSIVVQLVKKSAWDRAEFNTITAEFDLMPLGVIDSVNEWSDEHLGDFLLQGEDPITVNTSLVPA